MGSRRARIPIGQRASVVIADQRGAVFTLSLLAAVGFLREGCGITASSLCRPVETERLSQHSRALPVELARNHRAVGPATEIEV